MVQQVRRNDVSQRVQHRGAYVRNVFFEIGDQGLDARALQVRLRATQITRNDRKVTLGSILCDLTLRTVRQRPDNRVAPVVRTEFRRHRFERPDVEEVQQKRRDDVVGMMPERDLVTTLLDRNVVKNAATQTRTDGTIRLTFGNESFDYRICVALDNPKRNIELAQVFGQHFSGKSRLFLIEIHCQDLEINRRTPANIQQKIQQRVTVFAARKADHDAIAVIDHAEVGNRFAHATK